MVVLVLVELLFVVVDEVVAVDAVVVAAVDALELPEDPLLPPEVIRFEALFKKLKNFKNYLEKMMIQ